MKRVMCLYFPNWPIQRRLAVETTNRRRATIFYDQVRGKIRVVACCRHARERGVTPGMLLAEAQSLWPAATNSVRFEQHDPLADRQALRDLALWCHRFSPVVAVDDAETPDCLLMEPVGIEDRGQRIEDRGQKTEDRRQKTEDRGQRTEDRGQRTEVRSQSRSSLSSDLCSLASEFPVLAALGKQGYWAVAAIADTIGAAWAVAHYVALKSRSRLIVVPPGGHLDALRPLPVEALRLPADIVAILHDLNIFRIDELLVLPRAELPSRFGVELARCIDRALGWLPEMLTMVPLIEPLEASWDFEPPIADARILVMVIEHLLDRLLGSHAERGNQVAPFFGVQQLLCSLKLADRERLHFSVELLRPSAARRDLMDLVKLKVERLRIPTEVVAVTVRAAKVAPLEFQQEEIFGGEESHDRKELIGLLERLGSRLGDKAVLRPRLEPDAQPEFAYWYEPWLAATLSQESAPLRKVFASRLPGFCPIILKNQAVPIAMFSVHWDGSPQQFGWNGRKLFVERSWGPERIETGWWRGDDVRRDYYLVETTAGECYWLFQNLMDESWHLHGIFA